MKSHLPIQDGPRHGIHGCAIQAERISAQAGVAHELNAFEPRSMVLSRMFERADSGLFGSYRLPISVRTVNLQVKQIRDKEAGSDRPQLFAAFKRQRSAELRRTFHLWR